MSDDILFSVVELVSEERRKAAFTFNVIVFISPTLALSIVLFVFYDLRIYLSSIVICL